MTLLTERDEISGRLKRFLTFIERDPGNDALLGDAVAAAIDERELDLAAELLDRRDTDGGLTPALRNLTGVVALAQRRYEDATAIFQGLLGVSPQDPALRFNLAWAQAMLGNFSATHALLDDRTIAASSQGPALKIQAMHHLDLLGEGLATGVQLVERFPGDIALKAVLATLAMDAGDERQARYYADQAGDHPAALAARGMFALDEADTDAALDLFDRALAAGPDDARAWVGKGLALLNRGDADAAAQAIERGAAIFEDHLGSWIAAGWAQVIAGRPPAARAMFERAVSIDPTFAEGHGGLALVAILTGDRATAGRHCEVAQRLDRSSFGGALAKSLLLDAEGETDAAERVRSLALSTPLDGNGRTLADALTAMARPSSRADRR